MQKQKRKFQGVWIPAAIWTNDELKLIEKIFLVEIDSLDNEDGCFASNNYFAKFFKVTPGRCSQIVNSLIKKEYLKAKYIKKKDSKEIEKRILRTSPKYKKLYDGKVYNKLNTYIENDEGVFNKSLRGYIENDKDNNTKSNNTDNNTIKEKKSDKSEPSLRRIISNRITEETSRYTHEPINWKNGRITKDLKTIYENLMLLPEKDRIPALELRIRKLKERIEYDKNGFWVFTISKLLWAWEELGLSGHKKTGIDTKLRDEILERHGIK